MLWKQSLILYKKLPTLVRVFFWIVLCWSIGELLEMVGQPHLHIGFIMALGCGIFLFTDAPLQARGASLAVESGLATVLILAFTIHFGVQVIVPILEAEEMAAQPCNDKTLVMRCYSQARENCTVAWNRFSQDCRQESLSIRQARPTSLLGPVVKLCTLRKMDHAFRSTRKIVTDPDCKKLFADLDAPVFD